MSEKILDPREKLWARLHVAGALLFMLFYLFCPVNVYLWETVRYGYVALAIPLMVGFYFYFRGLRGGAEIRLTVYYAAWFFLTRVLNGQLWLQDDFERNMVCEMAMCSVILPAGLLLDGEGRKKLLNWLSAAMGLYLFALGLAGVYAVLTRRTIFNPITEATVAAFSGGKTVTRLNITDLNANISGFLFLQGFLLMVYQFFACRKKLWRVPIVLAAAVYYFVLTFTFCRSAMVAFSICVGMALLLLFRRRFPLERRWLRTLTAAVLLAVTIPLCYKSFGVTSGLISRAMNPAQTEETAAAAPAGAERQAGAVGQPLAGGTKDVYTDSRDLGEDLLDLHGRTAIFRGEFISLRQEPLRLLRGSLWAHVMDIVNQNIPKPHAHLHNYLMQVLGLTGLPGLLLVLVFTFLLVARMVEVYFSAQTELPVKLLTLPLTAYFLDGIMEIPMFGITDVRAYLFFLLAGVFLAWSYELRPPRSEKAPWHFRRRM